MCFFSAFDMSAFSFRALSPPVVEFLFKQIMSLIFGTVFLTTSQMHLDSINSGSSVYDWKADITRAGNGSFESNCQRTFGGVEVFLPNFRSL